MSEDMARAVGAKSPMHIVIAGKECFVRGLGLEELAVVERECLRQYRRQYLQTYSDNLDLLPPKQAELLLERKMDEVGRWDGDSLPTKLTSNPNKIMVTPELKERLMGLYELEGEHTDLQWKRLASSALDRDVLSDEDYRKLTGHNAPKIKLPYINWWITGSYDGMITMVWVCFQHNGVTREQVIEALRGNLTMLVDLSHEIERLSAPSVGNG